LGPDREIGRHFPLLNGECSRQETVNFCFWRIAAPNICPGQRVKQGAKCQTLSISKMWVSTAASSR
jgi:hypothetical protein